LIQSKLVTTFVSVEASTARFVNVSCSRQPNTNSTQHQYELLDVLAFNFCSGDYRLLVIDSVMALFRTDYSGRGELAERQQALGQFLKRLAALAEEFNVCVMMVSLTSIS
jgi:RecA/RadA recombinase